MNFSRKATAGLVLSAAALAAVPAVAVSQSGPSSHAAATRPAVSDLDVDLIGARTLEVTVEARHARTVKLTYGATTRTARLDPDDANDRDQDFTARFTARAADRVSGRMISIKVSATGATGTTTETLRDRVEIEDAD